MTLPPIQGRAVRSAPTAPRLSPVPPRANSATAARFPMPMLRPRTVALSYRSAGAPPFSAQPLQVDVGEVADRKRERPAGRARAAGRNGRRPSRDHSRTAVRGSLLFVFLLG